MILDKQECSCNQSPIQIRYDILDWFHGEIVDCNFLGLEGYYMRIHRTIFKDLAYDSINEEKLNGRMIAKKIFTS